MNPGKIFVEGIESLIKPLSSNASLNFTIDALLDNNTRVTLGKDNSFRIEMNYDNAPRAKL